MQHRRQVITIYTKIDQALQAIATENPISLRICGNCMAPVLQDQELVQVRKQRWYWPGDILAVRLANGRLVSHRLIGVYLRRKRLRFLTRADNSSRPDGSVTGEQILGKIISGKRETPISSPCLVVRFSILFTFVLFSIDRLNKGLSRNHGLVKSH